MLLAQSPFGLACKMGLAYVLRDVRPTPRPTPSWLDTEPIGIGKGSLALPVPCQQFQRMPALLRIFVNRLQLIYHERASGAAGW